jgi:hypothetical protein
MRKGSIGKRREAVTGGHAAGGRATGGCCDANPNQKPRSHDTSRIAWAKLMARVGEELPLECPNCGGDIRLRADGRAAQFRCSRAVRQPEDRCGRAIDQAILYPFVFHPNTGEVRSDGADGIACWFIDTDYNEESFFVRHAYFLGANDPYGALKTTLKAEINAEAWESLNSDTSRPFPKPKSGRIAVKVINHLGDELMKLFRV